MVCVLEKFSFQKCFLSILNRKAELFRFTHIFKILTLPQDLSTPPHHSLYQLFWGWTWHSVAAVSKCIMGLFGDAWLLRGCAENWSKFAHSPLQKKTKQSHSAVRPNISEFQNPRFLNEAKCKLNLSWDSTFHWRGIKKSFSYHWLLT